MIISVSGEEETVLHAQYPARMAEKNTKMNLRGHIFCLEDQLEELAALYISCFG